MDLETIDRYIKTLREDEDNFKNSASTPLPKNNQSSQPTRFLHFIKGISLLIHSFADYLKLYIKVRYFGPSLKNHKIVYSTKNFCNVVDGKLDHRILKPLFTDNIIFINPAKENHINKINDQKVYNLGVLVNVLSNFYKDRSQNMRFFKAYSAVNNSVFKFLNQHQVYTMCFYDLNSLSIIFSKYREKFTLFEVQHGSMINYPPYVKPAPVKIADVFYVKNKPTIDYLKSHLCKNFPAEYRLIPYLKGNRRFVPGVHILYASTVEFNGLHPVMKQFLANVQRPDLTLTIRLHPREKEKEPLFTKQLEQYEVNHKFDHSENWLQGNTIENLIVVSPWSSTIEDSYDNGFQTIIIDPVGRERYRHLIDNERCFYSDDLIQTLKQFKQSSIQT